MIQGQIVKSGGPELAHELEDKGYEGIRQELGIEAPDDVDEGPDEGVA
jgi:Fe-S cluster assembly ATP-binding protein